MTLINLIDRCDGNTIVKKITIKYQDHIVDLFPNESVLDISVGTKYKGLFNYRVYNIHCIKKNQLWIEIYGQDNL